MIGKGKIAEYRERLDETLRSHDLTHQDSLKSLVKDQILSSSKEHQHEDYIDNVIHKRTAELSNFLEMLRSASTTPNHEESHSAWKLKQDTEELRVMYREGPSGSPFHTLLAEGYVDAPLDACLCISWEAALFPKWFPETKVPTFKVVYADCLKRIRICEHISLVRVKLSWPLTDREALMHFFEFEYLKEGLVIAMTSTLDLENIQTEVDGYSKEGIPEPSQTVRLDLVGGFALQKVTDNRSYFRTIINMDIKLDLLPPYLVNFMSRQLIGSGFRLYKKTLTSATREDCFLKALNQPIYRRIRKALYSDGGIEENNYRKMDNNTSSHDIITDVNSSDFKECEEVILDDSSCCVSESSSVYMSAEDSEYASEIEQEEEERKTTREESESIVAESITQEHGGNSKCIKDVVKVVNNSPTGGNCGETRYPKKEKKVMVDRAIAALDRAIVGLRMKRMEGQKAHVEGSLELDSRDESRLLTIEGSRTGNRVVAPPASQETKTVVVDVTSSQDLRHGNAKITSSKLAAAMPNSTSHNIVAVAKLGGRSGAEGASEKKDRNEQKKTGRRKKWTMCCLHVVPESPVAS